MPTFTIIIPTYNCAYYLKDALKSLDNLTYEKSKIEVVIVDDGSIDNTDLVVDDFVMQSSLKVKFFNKKNGNWGSVINYVKQNRLATGDYITVLDADDTLHPEVLNRVTKVKNNYDLIVCDFVKQTKKFSFLIHVYPHYMKEPKTKLQAQTPFCPPLGKFLKKELFYALPDLKENIPYQDALFTGYAIDYAQSVRHINQSAGVYNYKRIGNSMSLPWPGKRYDIEMGICKDLLKLDAQEIVAIHIMRNKFRKLLKDNSEYFVIKRNFNFSFFPLATRWIMWLIYWTTLRRYFRIEKN